VKYVKEFLQLNCAPDVLGAVGSTGNLMKEITESMAILKRLKPMLLQNKMKYGLIDLCAGNALTGIMAAHFLPIREVVAIDNRDSYRKRVSQVKRFDYRHDDIYNIELAPNMVAPLIVISVHPCGKLAAQVIKLAKMWGAERLIMMPCCNSEPGVDRYPFLKMSHYDRWAVRLGDLLEKDYTIYRDTNCLSPKNVIIDYKPKN
jgi:hypothetical protein